MELPTSRTDPYSKRVIFDLSLYARPRDGVCCVAMLDHDILWGSGFIFAATGL